MSQSSIKSGRNHYQGINAHLNSTLQQHDWEEFHTFHITSIAGTLNKQLRSAGYGDYYAKLEKGIQIRVEGHTRNPESDVLILDRDPERSPPKSTFSAPGIALADITAILTLADLDPDRYRDTEYFHAIGLYEVESQFPTDAGRPVAWIEMLSPSNKQGGAHYRNYIGKREALLNARQMVFIEVDYLHESPPTLRRLDYSRAELGAKPYRISLIDAPGLAHSRTGNQPIGVIEFAVDEKIPPIPIPLHHQESLHFDLDAAYQHTFENADYGYLFDVSPDYALPPLNFHKYSAADQQRIRQRMAVIAETAAAAAQEGLPFDEYLEQHHLPVPLPIPAPQP